MKYNAGYDMQLRPPRTVYEKIFCPDGVRVEPHEYTVSKSSRYGGHLRHRHDGGLDRETALHWVLHHRQGATLRARLGLPPDEVADLLVRAAAMHPANKRNEATNMQPFVKSVADLGEHKYTAIIKQYASNNQSAERDGVAGLHPHLHRGQRAGRGDPQVLADQQGPGHRRWRARRAERRRQRRRKRARRVERTRRRGTPSQSEAHKAGCVRKNLHRPGQCRARAARAPPKQAEVI